VKQPFREPAVDFAALKIDALLVSGRENVRYLAGFTGSNGVVLIARGEPLFFTDPRYTIQSSREVSTKIRVVPRGSLIAAVAAEAGRRRLKRIGFERAHLSYEQFTFLEEHLPSSARLVPVGTLIEQQRMVKSAEELDRIRRSVITNSKAFATVTRKIRPGIREAEIAAELEYQMRRLGAEKPAFETIVASGTRTALPHAHPTAKKLQIDELVLIDMGASQDGYASDMTRVLHLGPAPARVRRMYRAVLDAQLAAIDAVRDGIPAERVDRAARRALAGHKLDRAFTHSTGHGLGLEIHEPPRLGKKDKTILKAGMAITIEPGAYIEDFGGIRIEDTVVVTPGGCEILTPTPKELITV
jgi:Xaa-Pro aminopeptidase